MNVPVRPPSFDDERTLLSARRVVPLDQLDAKVRRRRGWFLGGAFAIAMMLGAASALVASYLKLRQVPAVTASEVVEPGDTPSSLAVAANTPGPVPVESPEEEEAPKKEPIAKRHVVVKHAQEPEPVRDDPRITENERLQQIRDAVLYDEWQERRARRVFRRQRRLDRNHHRDLSNLDEIFEGRRP